MDYGMCRSWFCVLNNPENHGFEGSPNEIVEMMVDVWIQDNPQRDCAVIYCTSADGLKHCHAVFEDKKNMRFSVVQKLFPGMHIEPTKGNKQQAEDYINKRGRWEEKGEIIHAKAIYGEIKGRQGQNRAFGEIEELLEQGKTPKEILAMSFSYQRYAPMIKSHFFSMRENDIGIERDVNVIWHVGESGTGKSHSYIELCHKFGRDDVYLLTDYDHGFDKYSGEHVLFIDEFRGQFKFYTLMSLLDRYVVQVPCRYANVSSLWNEVHITSVLPPEKVYQKMVTENRDLDSLKQLLRRITMINYHYIDDDGKFRVSEILRERYKDYDFMVKNQVLDSDVIQESFNIFDMADKNK